MRSATLSLALLTFLLANCAPVPTQLSTATLIAATLTPHPTDTPAPSATHEATATHEPFDFEANFEPVIKFPGIERFDDLSFIPSDVAESPEFDAYLNELALEGKLGKFKNPSAVKTFKPEFSGLLSNSFPVALFSTPQEIINAGTYASEEKRPEYLETYFRTEIGDKQYLGMVYQWKNADGSINRFKVVCPYDKLGNKTGPITVLRSLSLDSFYSKTMVVPAALLARYAETWNPLVRDKNYVDNYIEPNRTRFNTLLESINKDPMRNVTKEFSSFLFYATAIQTHR